MEQTDKMEFIDLGLPSGLKWAKCNLGAKTETDYGDYFMWGSTTPNTADECNWTNAPFNNGLSEFDSTYFKSVKDTVCPNGILVKEYDAVSQIMGGDWRMPTKEEFDELLNNTTNEWIIVNGVNGRKFTSKTDTSKYIFIPTAGCCYNGSVYNVGIFSLVWSSSLGNSNTYFAWSLGFYSDNCFMGNYYRYLGLSIRPVIG